MKDESSLRAIYRFAVYYLHHFITSEGQTPPLNLSSGWRKL
ncbi:hypothetical protein V6M85_02120 [Sulfolobus tengchongensis]|uniref:Transposase n=1 Tax=Sulfolobus tengchongensis TaxID=207809 RepID=A0AAX4L2R6_9CREN